MKIFNEGDPVRITHKDKKLNGREGIVAKLSGNIILINLTDPEESRYFKRRSLTNR